MTDREKIDTIVCWVLYPDGEITTKIHDDKKPFPTDRRMEMYGQVFEEGMQKRHWLKNKICETRPYL